MDAETLSVWLKTVNLGDFLDNEEVLEHIQKLKDIIDGLEKEQADGEEVDVSKAERYKLVVVGDGAVGKTSLLISYAHGKFPSDYVPTVFENYTATMKATKKRPTDVLLHLWDTAGQEDYDRLRPLSYPGADVVLLCFSLTSKESYESVKEKWHPEVSHYLPSTPTILIGTKVDLRDESPDESHVTKEEGKALAKELECVMYLEVSSKKRIRLDDVFENAVAIVRENMGIDGKEETKEETKEEKKETKDKKNGRKEKEDKKEGKEKKEEKKGKEKEEKKEEKKEEGEEEERTAPTPSKKKKEKGGCVLF